MHRIEYFIVHCTVLNTALFEYLRKLVWNCGVEQLTPNSFPQGKVQLQEWTLSYTDFFQTLRSRNLKLQN